MQKLPSFLLASALFAGSVFAQGAASADPVIITAGDISIRRSEFEAVIKGMPADYQQYAMGPGKRQFATDFLRVKVLASEGRKQGLDRSPEIQEQLNMIRENLVATAQLQRLQEAAQVDEAALQKIYEDKRDEFERAKARHILIAFAGSPAAQAGKPELTEEQAQAKAEELRGRIAKGESFEDLAKAESDDVGSGGRGGDLGEFSRGQMVPAFEQAAFTTPVGELSPVIRTQFGFHIVKVDERMTTPFEEARAEIEREERLKQVEAILTRLIEAAKPTFDPAYFGG